MPTHPLLPLLDALLRLRQLKPAELESLLRQLPAESSDPQAAAQELLQRGWITPEQFASLAPAYPPSERLPEQAPEQPSEQPAVQPPARETILVGFGEDDAPLDPEAEDDDKWSLPTDDQNVNEESVNEESVQPPSQPGPEPVASLPTPMSPPSSPLSPPQPQTPPEDPAKTDSFEWRELEPSTAEKKPAVREDQSDQRMRQVMAWSGKGLFVWLLFMGSFLFGAWVLRPAAQMHSVAKPASRPSKPNEIMGERWWESKPLDVDAVIAAQQRKMEAALGQNGRPPSGGTLTVVPSVKGSPPPSNREKADSQPRLKLPPGSVLLGQEDQPHATAIAFRNNLVVATGNEEGQLLFWDAEKGTLLHSWAGHRERVNRIVVSGEGRCMVTTGNDRMIRVWNTMTRTEVRSWPCDALSLELSKDGRYVAAGCVDGVVRLTDLGDGDHWSFPKEPAKANPRSAPSPLCLAFNPESSLLAIGYGAGYTLVLDVAKRKQTQRLIGHRMVCAVAFSRDGQVLATAGKDATIKLWEVGTGKEIRTITVPGNQAVQTLAYGQRGPYLAAGSWDGSVHVWDLGQVGKVKLLQTIRLPAAGFGQQIDLSPNGQLLGCVHGGNSACVIPVSP